MILNADNRPYRDSAAAAGNQDALQERGALERDMTAAQIAEAGKLARDWKPRPN